MGNSWDRHACRPLELLLSANFWGGGALPSSCGRGRERQSSPALLEGDTWRSFLRAVN